MGFIHGFMDNGLEGPYINVLTSGFMNPGGLCNSHTVYLTYIRVTRHIK